MKLVFVCTPLGFNRLGILNKIEKYFPVSNDDNRIYFNFGQYSDLPKREDPFLKVSSAITQNLIEFPDSTFFYYGWEVTESLDNLIEEFPDAIFTGVITDDSNVDQLTQPRIFSGRRMLPFSEINHSIVVEYYSRQYNKLYNFYKNANKDNIIFENNGTNFFYIR
jgi:hypothetical protein